ncbi:hypothetical protein DH2020_029696 [Rehmannia glutinosa]|uniref:LRR receptor-like serine/threonine-protein kinase n=1 Tax=Rehmannia glutinosa TaxID=99300 RepID=A0ABR0VRX8_REHGL
MSRNYDNWERLVNATLLREELRRIGREDSLSSVSSSEFSRSFNEPDSPLLNSSSINLGPIKFSYREIALATHIFSDRNLMKQGHSGDLFTGYFPQLTGAVVVKRTRLRNREGFSLEFGFFSRINSHPRFVPLLGHCLDAEKEKFLVYGYLPQRDLSNSLFLKPGHGRRRDGLPSLDWITRWKIAVGVAEGSPKGTCAYDVYCFGKVLLELVTGKLGISSTTDDIENESSFEAMLPYISVYDKELIINIVDPSLVTDEDLLDEVWAMAIIARACLNPSPTGRPEMRHVLKALEDPFKLLREKMSWMLMIHIVETEFY